MLFNVKLSKTPYFTIKLLQKRTILRVECYRIVFVGAQGIPKADQAAFVASEVSAVFETEQRFWQQFGRFRRP